MDIGPWGRAEFRSDAGRHERPTICTKRTALAKFEKDVLPPGDYPSGKVTSGDLQSWVESFRKMREMDPPRLVPVPWDHPPIDDPAGYPMTEAEAKQHRAKFNAGWLDDLFIDDAGMLKARIDIPDPEDAKRIETVGGFVSPRFGTWSESGGTRFEDAVAHLALTPTPVSRNQSKTFTPIKTTAMSIEFVRDLSMADIVDGEKSGESDDKPTDEEKPDDKKSDEEKDETTGPAKDALDALKSLGVTVEKTSALAGDVEALTRLIEAVTSYLANKARDMTEPVKTEQTSQMSLEVKAQFDAQQAKLTEMSRQLDVQRSELTAEKRAKYSARITAAYASGRCDVPQKERLDKLAGLFEFSLDASQGPSELDIRLETVEALPAGAYWSEEQKLKEFSVTSERRNRPFFDADSEPDEDAVEAILNRLHPQLASSK